MKNAFVITGGGGGLGRELAKEAAAAGYPIALIGRDTTTLKKAKDEILLESKKDVKVSIHVADLVDPVKTMLAFDEIKTIHGGVEVLVNNAATWFTRQSIELLTAELIRSSFELNFITAFNATKEALRLQSELKSSTLTIINIGATASTRGGNQTAPFCIAKGALRSFSQSLAREVGPKGVHVAHLIIDGIIDNVRTQALNPAAKREEYIDPKMIAKTVLHVAGQDKSCWTFEWDVRPYNEKW